MNLDLRVPTVDELREVRECHAVHAQLRDETLTVALRRELDEQLLHAHRVGRRHVLEHGRVILAGVAPRERRLGSPAPRCPVHDERRRRTARSSWLASERTGSSVSPVPRREAPSATSGSGASDGSATGSTSGCGTSASRSAGGGSPGGSTVRSPGGTGSGSGFRDRRPRCGRGFWRVAAQVPAVRESAAAPEPTPPQAPLPARRLAPSRWPPARAMPA